MKEKNMKIEGNQGQGDARYAQGRTRRLVFTAMLFAVAMVLSVIESSFPLMVPIPGVKLGLSNIAVMYALFFLGKKNALLLAVLKGAFTVLTRGFMAGALSLSGGLCSIGVMIFAGALSKGKATRYMLSVLGALFHNIGQFAAVTVLYGNLSFFYYFPVLIPSGIIAGIATSALLKVIMPALKRISLFCQEDFE